MGARIGVEQQLVVVEAVAFLGRVGAVHAIAVNRAGARLVHVAVPDFVGEFRKFDALEFGGAGVVEQAELDLGGVGAEQGEVDAKTVPGGAKGMGLAFGQARSTWACAVLAAHGVLRGKSDPVQTLC